MYRPDVDALMRSGTRVAVGLDADSVGQDLHAGGTALAGALAVEPVTSPGGHLGYEGAPEGFAAALRRALADA